MPLCHSTKIVESLSEDANLELQCEIWSTARGFFEVLLVGTRAKHQNRHEVYMLATHNQSKDYQQCIKWLAQGLKFIRSDDHSNKEKLLRAKSLCHFEVRDVREPAKSIENLLTDFRLDHMSHVLSARADIFRLLVDAELQRGFRLDHAGKQ